MNPIRRPHGSPVPFIRARSVLDRLGSGVALSHDSAAVLHDLDLHQARLSDIHVTRFDGLGGRREAGVVHHEGITVPERDLTFVHGLPVVTPVRSLFEITTGSGTESGMVAVSSALHRGLTSKEELLELEPQFIRWPGYSHARLAIRLADPRLESVGESRSLFHMWRNGIPRPELQVEIPGPAGQTLGRVDFDWELHRHVGEFDGAVKYGAFGDGHEALIREKRREDLIRATGRGMSRWMWSDLSPNRVRAWTVELSEALARSRQQFSRNATHIPLS